MHSQEPWKMTRPDGGYIPALQDAAGLPVVYSDGMLTIKDANRIVAAVNFCKDIPTDILLQRDQNRRPIFLREGRDITSKEYVYVPLSKQGL